MTKPIRTTLIILSIVFSGVYFMRNFNKVDPTDKSLVTSYKQTKMNLYSPSTYRLANIIENRPEFDFYFRLEKNFTNIFKFSAFYSNYLELVIWLTVLLGIGRLFLVDYRNALFVSLPPLLVLTLFSGTKEEMFILFAPLLLMSAITKQHD